MLLRRPCLSVKLQVSTAVKFGGLRSFRVKSVVVACGALFGLIMTGPLLAMLPMLSKVRKLSIGQLLSLLRPTLTTKIGRSLFPVHACQRDFWAKVKQMRGKANPAQHHCLVDGTSSARDSAQVLGAFFQESCSSWDTDATKLANAQFNKKVSDCLLTNSTVAQAVSPEQVLDCINKCIKLKKSSDVYGLDGEHFLCSRHSC